MQFQFEKMFHVELYMQYVKQKRFLKNYYSKIFKLIQADFKKTQSKSYPIVIERVVRYGRTVNFFSLSYSLESKRSNDTKIKFLAQL